MQPVNMKSNDLKDIEELAILTPFKQDVYKKQAKFSSGKLFVETNLLQAAEPLEPWLDVQSHSLQ
ncbi:MAG: hypothetical protein F6K47_23015 [Symploca sp. SIO2E6]|nr:hypothetical protein [Symploca sp. SIO2E6]